MAILIGKDLMIFILTAVRAPTVQRHLTGMWSSIHLAGIRAARRITKRGLTILPAKIPRSDLC